MRGARIGLTARRGAQVTALASLCGAAPAATAYGTTARFGLTGHAVPQRQVGAALIAAPFNRADGQVDVEPAQPADLARVLSPHAGVDLYIRLSTQSPSPRQRWRRSGFGLVFKTSAFDRPATPERQAKEASV